MKTQVSILLLVCLGLTLAAADAQAGLLDLFKKSSDQKETENQTHRYDHFPPMEFFVGTLTRDGWTGWQVDDADLELTETSAVEHDGQAGSLREGSQAIVMGSRLGDKILAFRVRLLEPQWAAEVADNREEIRWSTSDPTVGEGTGPN